MNNETYQIPALLSLICVMSAMAFILSTYYWFWNIIKSPNKTHMNFSRTIWHGQIHSFIFVMILSILIGLYDFYISAKPLQISGEITILTVSLIISHIFQKTKTIKHIKAVMILGVSCIISWVITVIFGFSLGGLLYYLFYTGSHTLDFDIGFIPILVIGLLWNLPIAIMFLHILKNDGLRPHLKDLGLHKFLWPVMLAYLVLLSPLIIQDMVNSKNWQKMENSKPIRQI